MRNFLFLSFICNYWVVLKSQLPSDINPFSSHYKRADLSKLDVVFF
ncbi:hypothetical protein VIBNIMADA3020_160166 [Vibrio nigripulchritudo MADA3020]|nr:hypothetical protein VIBNIMADA3020_160166 [Vibrio nigripulchritudo MADA3020]